MFYSFILTESTISWSSTQSQQQHRWVIIVTLISSIICCYMYLQCLLPWLIKKLVSWKKKVFIEIRYVSFF
jgi:hypothetical protein